MNELVDIVQIIAKIPVAMDTVGVKCELKLIVFIRFSESFSIMTLCYSVGFPVF